MRAMISALASCRASRGDLRGGLRGSAVDKFGGALCVGCGGEHRSVITSQHFQPGCDIRCVIFARFKSKLEVSTEECGTEFSNPVPRQRNLRSRSDARQSSRSSRGWLLPEPNAYLFMEGSVGIVA